MFKPSDFSILFNTFSSAPVYEPEPIITWPGIGDIEIEIGDGSGFIIPLLILSVMSIANLLNPIQTQTQRLRQENRDDPERREVNLMYETARGPTKTTFYIYDSYIPDGHSGQPVIPLVKGLGIPYFFKKGEGDLTHLPQSGRLAYCSKIEVPNNWTPVLDDEISSTIEVRINKNTFFDTRYRFLTNGSPINPTDVIMVNRIKSVRIHKYGWPGPFSNQNNNNT